MTIKKEVANSRLNYTNILDCDVDDNLDKELRELLSICFDTECKVIFKKKRYCHELPFYRLLVYNNQILVGHAAIHKKEITNNENITPIGGVAEVCVHPDFRKKGIVNKLMNLIDKWLIEQNIPFSVLYGRKEIYNSSGYKIVNNLYSDSLNGHDGKWKKINAPLVKEIIECNWPTSKVYIKGKTF